MWWTVEIGAIVTQYYYEYFQEYFRLEVPSPHNGCHIRPTYTYAKFGWNRLSGLEIESLKKWTGL